MCTGVLMYLYRRTDWLNACNVSGAIIVVLVILVPLGLLVAPTVGGLVVMGQTISYYGTYTQIG